MEKERELHQLKSRFVAMASHEFRTPLSTIMGSVDLIGRYATGDEKVDKHVKRIRSKVRELTSMLNEFLSLERIEQGQTLVNPTSFDIIHHCIEQIEELRGLAKAGQSIDYDHSGEERTIGTYSANARARDHQPGDQCGEVLPGEQADHVAHDDPRRFAADGPCRTGAWVFPWRTSSTSSGSSVVAM